MLDPDVSTPVQDDAPAPAPEAAGPAGLPDAWPADWPDRAAGRPYPLIPDPRAARRTRPHPMIAAPPDPPASRGLKFLPHFAAQGGQPYDERIDLERGLAHPVPITWTARTATITDPQGKTIFHQAGCLFPDYFSDLAVNVVASKYFYGPQYADAALAPDAGGREHSLKQLVGRVADTFAGWGHQDGYFASTAHAVTFQNELTALLIGQVAAFNSPVWFNVGLFHDYQIQGDTVAWRWDKDAGTLGAAVPLLPGERYEFPQGSACFILSVADTMEAIAGRAATEMHLFKQGSGTGTDNSTVRSKRERLTAGGHASGPVSFLRIYDAVASVTKSGGAVRRAAKMETLKCRHPDILEFIEAKPAEERKARALIAQGYSSDFNGEAYGSVRFQNSNFSVRATDEFLRLASEEGGDLANWQTIAVTTGTRKNTAGEPMPAYCASELLDAIARGTWACGDPGIQYEDTIQTWHTCPHTAPINGSNPCSEYMFLDDSACNLASINLCKFRRADGTFDVAAFRKAVDILITAQEILVDRAGYPTEAICRNSHQFRPLGLGYCNLGALLMQMGLPYDSDEARSLAGAITAIMHGQANLHSAMMARELGAFAGFEENRTAMLAVMARHAEYVHRAVRYPVAAPLWREAQAIWDGVLKCGAQYGFRNSQVTVIAPTGTIAFMMDADTTGIEPDLALVKYKNLAGGGLLKIVNRSVDPALRTLGYGDAARARIREHLEAHDTIEGAPGLDPAHLPVFDCAFPPAAGGRSIPWQAHVKMMAAVQPFLSGAISKTCNLPEESTVADIREAYLLGWKLGLKALAIYRDGSKRSQPLSTSAADKEEAEPEPATAAVAVAQAATAAQAGEVEALRAQLQALEQRLAGCDGPYRRKLPRTRPSVTHHFSVQGHEGYLNVGLYPDTQEPGELFITMAKEGSTVGGLMDVIGTAVSIGLQYGVPLEALVRKFAHTRFEPSGFTGDPDVPLASSLADYIFRWLGVQYVPGYRAELQGLHHGPQEPRPAVAALSPAGAAENGPAGRPAALPGPSAGPLPRRLSDNPACTNCGGLTVRAGNCYLCHTCGSTSGCG